MVVKMLRSKNELLDKSDEDESEKEVSSSIPSLGSMDPLRRRSESEQGNKF